MERKWWQEAIGYQVYLRSYKDTNHDGMGDIRGVIEKLDHIASLGVTLIWVSPFYPSPLDDNGYDISDFTGVDPQLGTMDDVRELINKAHDRGIAVILDCVLNQSSDEHPWFIEAANDKNSEKRDYYIWGEGKVDEQGNRRPPSNWGSFFGDSAWHYNQATDDYYLKIFSDKMPDLNWSNPKLREAMAEVVTFWIELGVDGFRMDAIAHLGKDMTFTDSPFEENEQGIAFDWTKYSNRPQLYDYLHELYQNVFSKYDVVTVGEVGGGAKIEDALKYVNKDRPAIDMVFNFDHCWHRIPYGYEVLNDEKFEVNVLSLKENINYWMVNSQQAGIHPPVYWLNHDHPRVLSQYGSIEYHRESGTMLGMLLLSLPGTPFIYNGEEIGMTNVDYTEPEDFKDVNSRTFMKNNKHRLSEEQMMTHLRYSSRDNGHTPMQWDNSEHGGFSDVSPYLTMVKNFDQINVSKQESEPDSILNTYRTMAKIRMKYKEELVYGNFELVNPEHPDLFIFKRESLLLIANFRDRDVNYHLPEHSAIIHHNYQDTHRGFLRPFECLLLKL